MFELTAAETRPWRDRETPLASTRPLPHAPWTRLQPPQRSMHLQQRERVALAVLEQRAAQRFLCLRRRERSHRQADERRRRLSAVAHAVEVVVADGRCQHRRHLLEREGTPEVRVGDVAAYDGK